MGFGCLPPGRQSDCIVGEAQLVVEVADTGEGAVALIFSNLGSAASAIASVYVDDERATLGGPPEIHQESPEVLFSHGVNPRNLPGAAAATPAFAARAALSVSAENPHRTMGVNPGEQVGLIYPLSPGRTFEDVIADLSVGNLRFGLHVVGLGARGGATFVSQPLLTETIDCP
jgi:hypothetical protein